jgi:hypothetical protein
MTVPRFRLAAGALLLPLILAGAAPPAAALAIPPAGTEDGGRPRFEFFVRGSLTPSGTGATIEHSYDPHPGYSIPGSYVRQTLQVDPLAGCGVQAGLTVFFGRTFGIRLSAGHDETPFGGVNSPFEMSYKYTSWMPGPTGFEYIDGIRHTFTQWPDTSGTLRRTTVGLEAVVRIPLGPAGFLNLSGGPLLGFIDGEIHSLAYTELVYERYGALFFNTYFVRLALPAQTAVGFTGSAELEIRLDRRLSLVLGAAYRGGSYTGTPEIMAAYDYNSILEARTEVMGRIKTQIVPGRLELTPSPFVFRAGLAVAF